jgi:hypothetical protein
METVESMHAWATIEGRGTHGTGAEYILPGARAMPKTETTRLGCMIGAWSSWAARIQAPARKIYILGFFNYKCSLNPCLESFIVIN